MAEIDFFAFFEAERVFSLFVLHIKSRHQDPAVKQPFSLYWWAEFDFRQEPICSHILPATPFSSTTHNVNQIT